MNERNRRDDWEMRRGEDEGGIGEDRSEERRVEEYSIIII